MKHLFMRSLSLFLFFLFLTTTAFAQADQRESLNSFTYRITKPSQDKTYGFTEKNPIKVGGILSKDGPVNERRYLNALLGPNGEEIEYERLGSCCLFDTPNVPKGQKGLLDKYSVTYKGLSKPVILYLNMYDSAELFLPVGFTGKTTVSAPPRKISNSTSSDSGDHIIESQGLAGFWRQIFLLAGESELSLYKNSSHYKVLNPDQSFYMFITWPTKGRITPEGEFFMERDVTDVSFYGTYSVESDSTYSEYITSHAITPSLKGTKSILKYQFLDNNTLKIGYKIESASNWLYEYWKRVVPATN